MQKFKKKIAKDNQKDKSHYFMILKKAEKKAK